MSKYKTFRACSFVFLVLLAFISFLPYTVSIQIYKFRYAVVIISSVMFFIVYGFLFSILNYFKEPGWKKFALVSYLCGHIFSYYVFLYKSGNDYLYCLLLILFYAPFIVAFVTLNNPQIKPLSQSFGYTSLLVLIIRVGLRLNKGRYNISDLYLVLNTVLLIPSVILFLICNKMVSITFNTMKTEEQAIETNDLL